MQVNSDIICSIIRGTEFNHLISSKITIKEWYRLEFLANIDVPFGYDFIEVNNPFEYDLFTSSVIVRREFEEDLFTASLDVSPEPVGIIIDLDHFNMTKEFGSTINVKSVWLEEALICLLIIIRRR
jgi:hypothetical protein